MPRGARQHAGRRVRLKGHPMTNATEAAVTVYSKPNCQPCRMTKRKLDAVGTTYTEVDVTQDPAALAFVKGLGYTGAPVVFVSAPEGDYHWYGLDVANIERHITKRAA